MDPVLLIFAGLAFFVIFRLISVLGTRQGHEQHHDVEGLQRAARDDGDVANERDIEETPRVLAPVSENAEPLRVADPSFEEAVYLQGARAAYELIVESFAAGDLKSIRQFLSVPVYDAFKGAVAEREANKLVSELQFVGIEKASIVSASADDKELRAVTEFTSNQVRVTRDSDGNIVDGDANRIDLVKDRWTFSRPLNSSDPNWTLVETG